VNGIGCLKKLLEVISGLTRLVLEIMLSSGDELRIGVANNFVVVTLIVAGSDRDSLGLPLQPPLVAFDNPLRTLVGSPQGRPSTAAGGRFPAILYENSLDRLSHSKISNFGM
jgi:hypothetical protein